MSKFNTHALDDLQEGQVYLHQRRSIWFGFSVIVIQIVIISLVYFFPVCVGCLCCGSRGSGHNSCRHLHALGCVECYGVVGVF